MNKENKTTALILLLGNRDVQVPVDKKGELKSKISDYLDINTGDTTKLVIDKKKNFLEASEVFFKEIDYVYPFLVFPMLTKTLENLKEKGVIVDKVYLTTSKQESGHPQDAFRFADIIEYHLNKVGIEVEQRLCAEKPTIFPKMVAFYRDLYDSVKASFSNVIISNSGGTPAMRSASHFAGIFKGFDYVTISETDETNLDTFKKQEDLIIREIVEKMLDNYDYQGILKLPNVSDETKILCKYALDRIALNFDGATKNAKNLRKIDKRHPLLKTLLEEVDSADFTNKEYGKEMYYSAKIKYHKKDYSDYLWRLFVINEQKYKGIMKDILGEEPFYNAKDCTHPEWNQLLSNYNAQHPGFIQDLENYTIDTVRGKDKLSYERPNRYAYKAIIEITSALSSEELEQLGELDKRFDKLTQLRNDIAHKYKGISLKDISDKLPNEDLSRSEIRNNRKVEIFNDLLSDYFDTTWNDDFGIYTKINDHIRAGF